MADDGGAHEHPGHDPREPGAGERAEPRTPVEVERPGGDGPRAGEREGVARVAGRAEAAAVVEEAEGDEREQRGRVRGEGDPVRWGEETVHGGRILPALALLCAATALAACGGGSHAAAGPVAVAAAKTERAGGVDVTIRVVLRSAALPGGASRLEATGAFSGERGTLALDMTQLLRQAGAPAGIDGHVEEILLREGGDPVLYLDVPFLAAHMPGGKRWIRLDLKQAGASFGRDFPAPFGQASQSLQQSLELLRAGVFRAAGPARVGGVATTRYAGSVALRALPPDLADRLRGLGAPPSLAVQAWVGRDGLVRQLALRYPTAAGGVPASMAMTVRLGGFGRVVSVTAPPPATVFDAGGGGAVP